MSESKCEAEDEEMIGDGRINLVRMDTLTQNDEGTKEIGATGERDACSMCSTASQLLSWVYEWLDIPAEHHHPLEGCRCDLGSDDDEESELAKARGEEIMKEKRWSLETGLTPLVGSPPLLSLADLVEHVSFSHAFSRLASDKSVSITPSIPNFCPFIDAPSRLLIVPLPPFLCNQEEVESAIAALHFIEAAYRSLSSVFECNFALPSFFLPLLHYDSSRHSLSLHIPVTPTPLSLVEGNRASLGSEWEVQASVLEVAALVFDEQLFSSSLPSLTLSRLSFSYLSHGSDFCLALCFKKRDAPLPSPLGSSFTFSPLFSPLHTLSLSHFESVLASDHHVGRITQTVVLWMYVVSLNGSPITSHSSTSPICLSLASHCTSLCEYLSSLPLSPSSPVESVLSAVITWITHRLSPDTSLLSEESRKELNGALPSPSTTFASPSSLSSTTLPSSISPLSLCSELIVARCNGTLPSLPSLYSYLIFSPTITAAHKHVFFLHCAIEYHSRGLIDDTTLYSCLSLSLSRASLSPSLLSPPPLTLPSSLSTRHRARLLPFLSLAANLTNPERVTHLPPSLTSPSEISVSPFLSLCSHLVGAHRPIFLSHISIAWETLGLSLFAQLYATAAWEAASLSFPVGHVLYCHTLSRCVALEVEPSSFLSEATRERVKAVQEGQVKTERERERVLQIRYQQLEDALSAASLSPSSRKPLSLSLVLTGMSLSLLAQAKLVGGRAFLIRSAELLAETSPLSPTTGASYGHPSSFVSTLLLLSRVLSLSPESREDREEREAILKRATEIAEGEVRERETTCTSLLLLSKARGEHALFISQSLSPPLSLTISHSLLKLQIKDCCALFDASLLPLNKLLSSLSQMHVSINALSLRPLQCRSPSLSDTVKRFSS